MGWYHNKDVPVPLSSPGSVLLREHGAFIVTNQMSLAARRRALQLVHGLTSKQERDFSIQHRGPQRAGGPSNSQT